MTNSLANPAPHMPAESLSEPPVSWEQVIGFGVLVVVVFLVALKWRTLRKLSLRLLGQEAEVEFDSESTGPHLHFKGVKAGRNVRATYPESHSVVLSNVQAGKDVHAEPVKVQTISTKVREITPINVNVASVNVARDLNVEVTISQFDHDPDGQLGPEAQSHYKRIAEYLADQIGAARAGKNPEPARSTPQFESPTQESVEDIDSVIARIKSEAETAKKLESWDQYADLCLDVALLSSWRGDFNSVVEYTNRALLTKPRSVFAINLQGLAFRSMNRINQAEACFVHVLELAKDDRLWRATARGNLGLVFSSRGDWENAIAEYQSAIKDYRLLQSQIDIAKQLNNIAVAYKELGRIEDAEKSYKEAISMFEIGRDPIGVAGTKNNLGVILLRMGRRKEAELLHREAIDVAKRAKARVQYADALNDLANILMEDDNWSEAESLLREAVQANSEMGRQHNLGLNWMNLAQLQLLKNDKAGARDALRQVQMVLAERDDPQLRDGYESLECELLLSENVEAAKAMALGLLERARSRRVPATIWSALVQLAEISIDTEDWTSALKYSEEAYQISRRPGFGHGAEHALVLYLSALATNNELLKARQLCSAESLRLRQAGQTESAKKVDELMRKLDEDFAQ